MSCVLHRWLSCTTLSPAKTRPSGCPDAAALCRLCTPYLTAPLQQFLSLVLGGLSHGCLKEHPWLPLWHPPQVLLQGGHLGCLSVLQHHDPAGARHILSLAGLGLQGGC